MGPFIIIGLGEVLWDLFPSGKQLGGAPSNFAYITHLLGDRGMVASRVGNDELGHLARIRLTELGLDSTLLQTDRFHPTGTVQVNVDNNGQPSFEITRPVAWDFLQWTSEWKLIAEQADAVCFGSLAQRSPESRATIRTFLQAMRPGGARIFDVNLRQTFYSTEIILQSLQHAHVVKLNHEELPRVMQLINAPCHDDVSAARQLLRIFNLDLVCVTRGEKGSLLVNRVHAHEQPGFTVKVVDTVGSGDAFTAALVHHYLRKASLEMMNLAANQMGAWVAGQAGGTPPVNAAQLACARRQ